MLQRSFASVMRRVSSVKLPCKTNTSVTLFSTMKNKSKMVDRKNTSITSINNKCQAKIMTRLYTTDKAPPQNPEDTIDKQTIQAAGQLDPESMAEFNDLTSWVQHFYSNKHEANELFRNIVRIMSNTQYSTFKSFLHGSLVGVLLAAMCEKGENFPGWKRVRDNFDKLPKDTQAAFYAAGKLNEQLFSGIPDKARLTFNTVLNLDTISLPLHIKIQLNKGFFFYTGDTLFVDRMMDYYQDWIIEAMKTNVKIAKSSEDALSDSQFTVADVLHDLELTSYSLVSDHPHIRKFLFKIVEDVEIHQALRDVVEEQMKTAAQHLSEMGKE